MTKVETIFERFSKCLEISKELLNKSKTDCKLRKIVWLNTVNSFIPIMECIHLCSINKYNYYNT